MRSRIGLIILVVVVLIVVVIGGFTLAGRLLDPRNTPQYAVALEFIEAVHRGDDAAAIQRITPELQTWVATNCPGGSISICLLGFYIPDDWGNLLSVVFRRSEPVGSAWNVDMIATYEHGLGFSGVCIYTLTSQQPDGRWLVSSWAGFISCGDARSRDMASNPDTPNRAP